MKSISVLQDIDDYHNDGTDDDDDEDSEISPPTSRAPPVVTPLAYTRTVVSAVDPIAATNARPIILTDGK